MGKKEYLQKELDWILEKLKFWRYVVLAIISGMVSIIFAMSQNKIKINFIVFLFIFLGFIVVFFAVKRISNLTKEYKKFIEELKETE